MVRPVTESGAVPLRIDDCWNRIGTRGDGSCPKLAEHTRCLNCPVFEQNAAALLDRPLDTADSALADITTARSGAPEIASGTRSALVFRVADEWLALPTEALRHIDDVRPIHSLPHRRNGAVLGVVNIRGTLTVAASLANLLQIERTAHGRTDANTPRTGYTRMLVAAHQGDSAVFPVDEVDGVMRFPASAPMPVPATLAQATASHASGVLAWRATTVGLLEPGRVFDTLARSLR